MTLLLSNLVWEINSIIKPLENTYQRTAASIYLLSSLISVFFFASSFRKNYEIKFCYPGYALVAFRNTIRMFDFEQTILVFGAEKFFKLGLF